MDVEDAGLHRRVVGVADDADQLVGEGDKMSFLFQIFQAKLSAPELFLI